MSDQARQSSVAIPKIEVIEIGCRERRVVTRGAPDLDQLVRALHARQWREQDRLDPGEIVAFAPMPKAKVITTVSVKPGRFRSIRTLCRRSCQRVSIAYGFGARDGHWDRTIIDLNAHLE